MKEAKLEKKIAVNGIFPKIVCHMQTVDFPVITANAHYHSYIEVLYCTEGSFCVYLNNAEYTFAKGDMVLISSGETHSIEHTDNTNGTYIVVRLEPEVLYNSTQTLFEIKHLLAFTIANNRSQKVFTKSELEFSDIPYLIKNILREHDEQAYGYELAMHADVCRLFLWILRYWKSLGRFDKTPLALEDAAEKLYPAIEYIHANFSEDISAEYMAQLCKMSYSYFSRSFKSVFSKSFNDYLNQIRVFEAEKLLLTTNMSITDIGFQIGYTTTSYFIHQFKKFKNISPKQYKINFQK